MKKALSLLLAAAMTVSLAACGGGSSASQPAQGDSTSQAASAADSSVTEGGTLTYNISFDPNTLLPWDNSPGLEFEFYICEYLLKVDENGELQPWLTESI